MLGMRGYPDAHRGPKAEGGHLGKTDVLKRAGKETPDPRSERCPGRLQGRRLDGRGVLGHLPVC